MHSTSPIPAGPCTLRAAGSGLGSSRHRTGQPVDSTCILEDEKRMARPKDLLTLARIADETGISYATLRSYALKHAEEIPSEGEGRNTRYPRAAVKVFQRLRRESKPGRKPASASAINNAPAPVPAPAVKAAIQPAAQEASSQAQRPAGTDTSRLERELTAIGGYLQRIADSLEKLASEPRSAAPAPEPAAGPAPGPTPVPAPEERPEASAPAAPAAPERTLLPVPPPAREGMGTHEPGGHRRLHSLPKVMGQRGKRPD